VVAAVFPENMGCSCLSIASSSGWADFQRGGAERVIVA
jgi:hypothetical protein